LIGQSHSVVKYYYIMTFSIAVIFIFSKLTNFQRTLQSPSSWCYQYFNDSEKKNHCLANWDFSTEM